MAKMLGVKIEILLTKLGSKGITRGDLLRHFGARAEELDRAVERLKAAGKIEAWVHQTHGRPATTYYDPEAVKDLTPPAGYTKAVPVEDIEPDAEIRTTSCKTCGRAIPVPPVGRPFVYCSQRCKKGGYGMQSFLARAWDTKVFAEVSVLLVMADLCMRGYDVARPFYKTGQRVLATDDKSGIFIDVVPVGLEGRMPNPLEYETVAFVYRDGLIRYGGRSPLVMEIPDEPASEDESVANNEGEQNGANES
jgi:hypothetical protein